MSVGIVGTMFDSARNSMVAGLKSIEQNEKLGKYGKPVAQAVVLTVAAVAATALLGIVASFLEIVTAVATLAAAVVIASPFFAENEVAKKVTTTALAVLDQLLDRLGLKNMFEGNELKWITAKDTKVAEVAITGAVTLSVDAQAALLRNQGWTVIPPSV